MIINDNILLLIEKSPSDVLQGLALRVKTRRLEKNLTQKSFAAGAGMPLPTYRRFESSGEISLRGLVQLAFALDRVDELEKLFETPIYNSISEMVNIDKRKKRKRGSTG